MVVRKPKTVVGKVEKEIETIGKEIGKITHYFEKAGVAVVDLLGELKIGDTIAIKGATTKFDQVVDSMQVQHEKIKKAKKGDAIGLKVKDRVRLNDTVYLKE